MREFMRYALYILLFFSVTAYTADKAPQLPAVITIPYYATITDLIKQDPTSTLAIPITHRTTPFEIQETIQEKVGPVKLRFLLSDLRSVEIDFMPERNKTITSILDNRKFDDFEHFEELLFCFPTISKHKTQKMQELPKKYTSQI